MLFILHWDTEQSSLAVSLSDMIRWYFSRVLSLFSVMKHRLQSAVTGCVFLFILMIRLQSRCLSRTKHRDRKEKDLMLSSRWNTHHSSVTALWNIRVTSDDSEECDLWENILMHLYSHFLLCYICRRFDPWSANYFSEMYFFF